MSPETLRLLSSLVDQVTLSASVPPNELEQAARQVAQAKRELAEALSSANDVG